MISLLTLLLGQLSPPIMEPREIGPPAPITGGTVVPIEIKGSRATLFIPDDYQGPGPLWVHFHTADWFVVQEFQRAGYKVPILIFNLGQGSSVYGRPFTEPGTLQPFVMASQRRLGGEVTSLSFTSFSAGYGAVRNLVKDPDILRQLKTVILCDSLYASLDESKLPDRVVASEHLTVWQPLIDRALAGQTTVVMTTSQITPDTYAGTWEVAQSLVRANRGEMTVVRKVDTEQRYLLLRTYDKADWHVWSYAGEDAMAHMTHPRRLAEILRQVRP